jgi:4-amino-4-deoxy-L-arabinose transferase-like glycosyltransferase
MTGRFAAVMVAGALFLALYPALGLVEFHYGVERLVAQSSLEARRDGHWLIPRLEGEPRIRKPPLTTWASAAAVRPDTVEALSSSDPAVRDAAYRSLARQMRWPALLAGCVALIFIYELGRLVLDPAAGMASLLVAGTSVYFITFSRLAITDTYLLLWVSAANAMLARAVFQQDRWLGILGAGVALGLGLMTKGPVCIVQSVVPAAIFVGWDRWKSPVPRLPVRMWSAPIMLGATLMLVIGGWWFAMVAFRHPEVWRIWSIEVWRTDPAEKATGTRLDYLSIFGFMMPWTIFFAGGLILAVGIIVRVSRNAQPAPDGLERRIVLPLAMVVMPIVIMSLFRDRKERYLLPLLGPAAVLAAFALVRSIRSVRLNLPARLALGAHWAMILLVGVAFPLAAMSGWLADLRTVDGSPWLGVGWGTATILFVVIGVGGLALAACRRPALIVPATAILVLAMFYPYVHGYSQSNKGRSELRPLAELIRQHAPDARVYEIRQRGRKLPPQDLPIYVNRNRIPVPSVRDIPPSQHPQIYIELWRGGDAEPDPAAGWRVFAKVARNEQDWWVAFIRNPRH